MASPTPNLVVHHLQIGQGERIPFLLEELALPYTIKLYKRAPLLSPPELKALHPMGASPVLQDLTTTPETPLLLAESGAIVEYLLNKYGNGSLSLPPSHANYADYLYWLHFSNGNLQPTIFRRATVKGLVPDLDDKRYKMADGRVQTCLQQFNERVASNTWLAGDEFTAADVMSMWCFTTMRQFEPFDLTEYPGILGWLKRVSERPAYKAAMAKGDPDLDIEAGISAKGPSPFGAFAAARAEASPKREKL
ncbi:glutathione S-transferase [Amniculicola lignicola CBS 123094]|uniref:Glutathione S-transferase n=1 Tax=Amniculicola lignicola CBS 123094 TaxID=1392246 RepID=A0A6A5WF67_9PLEO|nr:glutathione S-transferase [Amniculicola lignicola CBS 123094]